MKISVFFDHILQAVEQTGKSLAEILNEVKAAGIDGLEINLSYLMEHEEILQYLNEAGLHISCIYEFYEMDKLNEEKHSRNHIEMAARVGAKNILVVPGFLSEAEALKLQKCKEQYEETSLFMENSQSVQHMINEMRYICNLGEENNINVTIEDFDDFKSPISSLNGIKYFLEQISNLKFTLDMGNFAYSDEDVLAAWSELKHRVTHVHCKDRGAVKQEENLINRGLLTVAVGDGYIPVMELVKKVVNTGYDGYFAIEHFDAPNQEIYIKKSAAFLKKHLPLCQ